MPTRVQLLVGPAGVGKTVLANDVVGQLTDRTVAQVIGLAELAGVPLGAFGPLLARLDIPNEPGSAVPSLMATIERGAQQFVLFVDDIARLDDVSAAALYQLVRAFGVPTVATWRLGERLPASIQRMLDEGLTERHDVKGFALDQVSELLESRFKAPVSYADVRRLTDRTSGNPLYLRVLVERAQHDGKVWPEGDVIHIDEGDAPADLVNAMATRITGLTAEQRRILRLVTLLQPVTPDIVAATPQEVTLVAELELLGLVAAELGTGRLRITHPLIGEGIVRDSDPHADIAEAVQRLRATGDDRDRLLAIQLQLRGSELPPLAELVWGSIYAYGMGDLTLAAELAESLLARDADRTSRCAALTTFASSQSLLGEHSAAELAFAEAESLATTPDELALIAVRRGEHLSYRRYDLAGAVAQAERIRARISAESDVLDDSLKQWDASLDVIAGMPLLGRLALKFKPELAIRSAILLVVSRSTRGDLGEARTAVKDLSRIQEQIGQVDPLAAAALGYQANVVAKQGRVDEARRMLDAMTPAQRTGRNAYVQVAEAEAWILAHSGDLDGAVGVVERAVKSQGERGSAFLAALAACIPIRLGFADRAADLLKWIDERSPTPLELVRSIRDLAVALRDRDLESLPGVLSRVEASGQEPTVLDAIAQAMKMGPRPELRRKLDLTRSRILALVDERPLIDAPRPLLSSRELEVARAASARERTKEIAARLGTSARTVDTQLQSAYRKLGVSSRDGLRAAMLEVGLLDARDAAGALAPQNGSVVQLDDRATFKPGESPAQQRVVG